MNLDNTKKVYSRFPKIFERKLTWGFEFDDGWYDLIVNLCTDLQRHIDESGAPQVVCIQAKEKYGTLRFYVPEADSESNKIIDEYCKKSATTCEDTGGVGSPHKRGFLVKTLCPSAAALLGYESVS